MSKNIQHREGLNIADCTKIDTMQHLLSYDIHYD